MKTPDPNCGKTAALTFIILYMLTEIINKMIFNVWKIKETPCKTLLYFILMNFHSSTPQIDCRNEIRDPNYGKTVALTFIIPSMLPEII